MKKEYWQFFNILLLLWERNSVPGLVDIVSQNALNWGHSALAEEIEELKTGSLDPGELAPGRGDRTQR